MAIRNAVYKNETRTSEKMLKVPFVDLKEQYEEIKGEVSSGINEVLGRCDFILGAKVREFEHEFSSYCGVKYASGVASGTDALHLALKALGIGEGDEVITQANTFIATVLAISYTGATPVLIDIDPETCNMDTSKLERAVTEKTKAILPVHLYGQTAEMDKVSETAARHNLFVVEDACQAHGAYYHGAKGVRRAGALGDVAAFSFYPGKNLGAYGDGGALTTENPEIFEKIRLLRDYGQAEKYHHVVKGYNSRLDTLQAAVLLVKLKHLDKWNRLRVSHAIRYTELLGGIPEIKLPKFKKNEKSAHVFHLFVVRVEERDGLIEFLNGRNISTGIHYPVPAHMHEAFRDLGYKKGDFPVTEKYSEEILSLPMFPELRDEQIMHVTTAIREFYGR